MRKAVHPDGLNGSRGLLAAVIALAMADARGPDGILRASARAYFAGDVYRTHLQALDLPDHWLPTGLEPLAAGDEMAEKEPPLTVASN